MRFVLEVVKDASGRFLGHLAWEEAESPAPFSGTLELLRLLEEQTPSLSTATSLEDASETRT